jgi:hypothetical protein
MIIIQQFTIIINNSEINKGSSINDVSVVGGGGV